MSLKGPILIIEDDEDDQFLIGEALKAQGLPNTLLFFPNGQEALHFLESTPLQPFLILCDVNMPLMNGLELRRIINTSETLRRRSIPFVFLTTASNSTLVGQAYDETVQGFFQKASTYDELQTQIQLIVTYWRHCLHPNRFV
ncbi:hypothetical protein GCM10027578_25780 [Spirosoma luteolum]